MVYSSGNHVCNDKKHKHQKTHKTEEIGLISPAARKRLSTLGGRHTMNLVLWRFGASPMFSFGCIDVVGKTCTQVYINATPDRPTNLTIINCSADSPNHKMIDWHVFLELILLATGIETKLKAKEWYRGNFSLFHSRSCSFCPILIGIRWVEWAAHSSMVAKTPQIAHCFFLTCPENVYC